MTAEHTLIHVKCDACGGVDTLTIVEHPRDSAQTKAVAEAHHTLAESHADDTGHHVEVGETEGRPSEIRKQARAMASGFSGVEREDFAEVKA
jgi:hypothetical protein